MAYTLAQINDINNNKSAVYKQIYIDVNGFKWIGKPDGSLQNYNNTNPFTVEDDIVWIIAELSTKQDLLVSGVNIKTINGDSILGSGDIVISGGGGTWGSITGTITDQTDLIAYLVANYEPLLGYTPVPETRTLTINGSTYDLSANRSWTIAAGVTNVTATLPLSSSGGATPDISISLADTSNDGYLSSTDWNTFNDKVDGPASSVDSNFALFDGTTGKLIKEAAFAATDNTFLRRLGGVIDFGSVNADFFDGSYSNGNVLSTDGSGNLIWSNPATSPVVGTGVTLWPTQTAIVTGLSTPTSLYTLTTSPTVTGPTSSSAVVNNNTVLIDAHLYNTALGVTSIPSGAWIFNIYAAVSNTGQTNQIITSVCKAVVGSGTVTITGTGTTRTVTASSSMFTAGDYNADIKLTSYIQLPDGFFPISGYTSGTVVTITVPLAYVNTAGVAYNVHRALFSNVSVDITSSSGLLYHASVAQPAFTVNTTDKLSLLFFGYTNANTNRTITYYQNGNTENTSVTTPLVENHNSLQGLQGGTTNEYYHLTNTQHSVLTGIAGLSAANDDIIQRKSGSWTNRTMAQLIADLAALGTTFQPLDSDLTAIAALSTTSFGRGLLTETSASTLRTTLSLVVGTNVQAWDTDLDDLSSKWTKASSSGAATLQFHEDTDNGTNKVTLKPAESLSADYTVTLPSETGTLITTETDEFMLSMVSSFRFLTNN